jgi:hypothetical protein
MIEPAPPFWQKMSINQQEISLQRYGKKAFLEKHGIGFSGQTLSVLKDWNENGQLGASYEPSYMLDVAGHPMDRSIWMAVSKQVEQFIDRNPQWKTQLLNINGGTVPQTVERLMTQDKDGMHVTMGQELKDNGLTQNNGTIKINAQAVIKHAKRTM